NTQHATRNTQHATRKLASSFAYPFRKFKIATLMLIAFLILPYSCEKEERIEASNKAKFYAPTIFDAKRNFEQQSTLNFKDANNYFQSRELQTSLSIDWELSQTKKYKDEPEQEVDILYTPIYINNDAQAKMFLGSVEYNGIVASNLFFLYYTDTENTDTFSGYILRFDLDGVLQTASKYINGVLVDPDNISEGTLGRSSNSECTDFATLFQCLADYFGNLDASNWHLGGLLDEVVVTAYLDAGPSGPGSSSNPFDTAMSYPINILPVDIDDSNSLGGVRLPWWSVNRVTANGFNVLQWLEIHPLTLEGQWLMTEATDEQLQEIANFLNAHMFRIRDEFPDLDGFEPANSSTASTGYAISESASGMAVDVIGFLMDNPNISLEFDPNLNNDNTIEFDSLTEFELFFNNPNVTFENIIDDDGSIRIKNFTFNFLAGIFSHAIKVEIETVIPDANSCECMTINGVTTILIGNTTLVEWEQIGDYRTEISNDGSQIKVIVRGTKTTGIKISGFPFRTTQLVSFILTFDHSTGNTIDYIMLTE
uniref:hypothetical protein n=1 Tax=Paucihalobacter sp. TaxID=2850405 RepID=UPI002FE24110